jgi:hypothetical protein
MYKEHSKILFPQNTKHLQQFAKNSLQIFQKNPPEHKLWFTFGPARMLLYIHKSKHNLILSYQFLFQKKNTFSSRKNLLPWRFLPFIHPPPQDVGPPLWFQAPKQNKKNRSSSHSSVAASSRGPQRSRSNCSLPPGATESSHVGRTALGQGRAQPLGCGGTRACRFIVKRGWL